MKNLLTLQEFKKQAKTNAKNAHCSLGVSLNALAKAYGYSCYEAIKTVLKVEYDNPLLKIDGCKPEYAIHIDSISQTINYVDIATPMDIFNILGDFAIENIIHLYSIYNPNLFDSYETDIEEASNFHSYHNGGGAEYVGIFLSKRKTRKVYLSYMYDNDWDLKQDFVYNIFKGDIIITGVAIDDMFQAVALEPMIHSQLSSIKQNFIAFSEVEREKKLKKVKGEVQAYLSQWD